MGSQYVKTWEAQKHHFQILSKGPLHGQSKNMWAITMVFFVAGGAFPGSRLCSVSNSATDGIAADG